MKFDNAWRHVLADMNLGGGLVMKGSHGLALRDGDDR
jgi:hypothetical protein